MCPASNSCGSSSGLAEAHCSGGQVSEPLSTATTSSYAVLLTQDGGEVVIEEHIARRCEFFRRAFLESKDAVEEHGNFRMVKVPNEVSYWALFLTMDFCKYDWPGDEMVEAPLKHIRLDKLIEEDDEDEEDTIVEILDSANPEAASLCELASAAYVLECKPLVELTCKAIAGTIRGRSPEQIRELFNIVNDFTPEEEEQVKKSVLERTLMMDCSNEGGRAIMESPVTATASRAVNPIRDKLREKLKTRKDEDNAGGADTTADIVADRDTNHDDHHSGALEDDVDSASLAHRMTVDELVAYINASDDESAKKASKRKTKRSKAKAKRKKKTLTTKSLADEEDEEEREGDDDEAVIEPPPPKPSAAEVEEEGDDDHEYVGQQSEDSNEEIDQFRLRLEMMHRSQLLRRRLVKQRCAKTSLAPELSSKLSDALRHLSRAPSMEARSPSPILSSSPSSSSSMASTPVARSTVNDTASAASVTVRASTIRQSLLALQQHLKSEELARHMLEERVSIVEGELLERVKAAEQRSRHLEHTLKQEQMARIHFQAKIERRHNALEHMLVMAPPPPSPRTTTSRSHTLFGATRTAG